MELQLPLNEFAENHSLLGREFPAELDGLPAILDEFESHGLDAASPHID